MRHEPAVRVGAAAADFREVFVGDAQIAPVREIIEHRRGGDVLLAVRQLLDLLDRVAEKLRHVHNIAAPRLRRHGRARFSRQQRYPRRAYNVGRTSLTAGLLAPAPCQSWPRSSSWAKQLGWRSSAACAVSVAAAVGRARAVARAGAAAPAGS